MYHDNDAYMSHSRRIKERSNRLHSEIPLVIGTPACKRSGKRNVEMNSDPTSTFCVCGGVDGKVDTARHVKGSFNVQGEINLWWFAHSLETPQTCVSARADCFIVLYQMEAVFKNPKHREGLPYLQKIKAPHQNINNTSSSLMDALVLNNAI